MLLFESKASDAYSVSITHTDIKRGRFVAAKIILSIDVEYIKVLKVAWPFQLPLLITLLSGMHFLVVSKTVVKKRDLKLHF